LNKRVILLVLLGVVLIGIFFFSTQEPKASHRTSDGALEVYRQVDDLTGISSIPLLREVKRFISETIFDGKYNAPEAFIRKIAHLCLYAVLGLVASLFGWFYGEKLLIALLLGMSMPAFIAVMDERFQKHIGRTGSLEDVYLDVLGGVVGSVIGIVALIIVETLKKKNSNEH
jgi:VanZ family protein